MNGFRWLGRRHVVPETPLALAERLGGLHADPRLVHTSETPQELAGEATVDAEAQAERDAAMEALKARVNATNAAPVVRPAAAPVDLGATIAAEVQRALAAERRTQAERERREAEGKARAAREEQERLARGGPCQYCGLVLSWERGEDDQQVGRWYENGKTCTWCERDLTEFHVTGRRTDPEHRVRVLKEHILGPAAKGWLDDYVLEKCSAFRWWRDVPGAPSVERLADQFPQADRAALVAALEPPEIEFSTREPCPRCGCASRWLWTRSYQPAGSGHVQVDSWICKGCCDAGELNDVISRRIGLTRSPLDSLGAAAPQVLGVSWWSESGAEPCPEPFEYVDWGNVTRRAYKLFPGERKWGGWMAWQRAQAVARQ